MKKPITDRAAQEIQKTCRTCLETKPVSEFKFTTNKTHKYYRVDCKQCHSTAVYRTYLEKKITMFPDKYYDCSNDECNWIWARSRGTTCPKCHTEVSQ